MLSGSNLAHLLAVNPIVLFISGSSKAARNSNNQLAFELVKEHAPKALIIDLLQDDNLFSQLLNISPWRILPQLFVCEQFIGGVFVMEEFFRSGEHLRMTGEDSSGTVPTRSIRQPMSAVWRIVRSSNKVFGAGSDGCIHVFDRKTFKVRDRIAVSSGWLNSIDYSPGNLLIGDTLGKIYQVSRENEDKAIVRCSVGGWVNGLEISNCGSFLYVIDGLGDLYRMDIGDWDPKKIYSFGSIGWTISIQPSSGRLAIGLNDGRLIIASSDMTILYSAKLYNGPITTVRWSGNNCIFCGFDPQIGILDTSGFQLKLFCVHRGRIWDVQSIDSQIFSSSGDQTISVFCEHTSSLKNRFQCASMPIMLDVDSNMGTIHAFLVTGEIQRFKI